MSAIKYIKDWPQKFSGFTGTEAIWIQDGDGPGSSKFMALASFKGAIGAYGAFDAPNFNSVSVYPPSPSNPTEGFSLCHNDGGGAGTERWRWCFSQYLEAGGDSGSDIALIRFHDNGTPFSGAVIAINRATGHVVLNNLVTAWYDGRISSQALHNNSNGMAGTTEQFVGSGTYSPTGVAVANVSSIAAVTTGSWKYTRVGNVVRVSGLIIPTLTAGASTLSQLRVPLPIATALAANEDLNGCGTAGSGTTQTAAFVRGDTATNQAFIQFPAPAAGATPVRVEFSYEVK